MTRRIADEIRGAGHGRRVLGGQPLVFHCNHYNYWLQKTLRLDPSLGMDGVIRDAAEGVVYGALSESCQELGLTDATERLAAAADLFAHLGFGTMDFASAGEGGGMVRTPVSHYGQLLAVAAGGPFDQDQNLFDQGFAAAALAVAFGKLPGSYSVTANVCQSRGASVGEITLAPSERAVAPEVGLGPVARVAPPPRTLPTGVDEDAVLAALAGLDLTGNEEGIIPRFGVALTHHFANFYNRISFEFVRRMAGSGLVEEARELLVDAGYHCAFNTFGGIMTSAEWDAVVRPMCATDDDWVHGMVAVVNALGWGTWRVHALDDGQLTVTITDDYESTGYVAMYGRADVHVAYLASGGVAGIQNLVRVGAIAHRPRLDPAFFAKCFEADGSWRTVAARCAAQGDPVSTVRAAPLG